MAQRAVEGGFNPDITPDAALPQQEFNSRWAFHEMPACPVGMVLLRDFALSAPTLFATTLEKDFCATEPRDLAMPAFKVNRQWLAFRDHRNTCEDCNER